LSLTVKTSVLIHYTELPSRGSGIRLITGRLVHVVAAVSGWIVKWLIEHV